MLNRKKRPICIAVSEIEDKIIKALAKLWKKSKTGAVMDCVMEKWNGLVEADPTLKYSVYTLSKDRELAELEDKLKELGDDYYAQYELFQKIYPDAATGELIGAIKGIIADEEIKQKLRDMK